MQTYFVLPKIFLREEICRQVNVFAKTKQTNRKLTQLIKDYASKRIQTAIHHLSHSMIEIEISTSTIIEMVAQLFWLTVVICFHSVSASLRIRQSRSLLSVPTVLKGLGDNSIVIAYDRYLEVLEGKHYQEIKQRIDINEQISEYNISPSKDSLIYLQNGKLKFLLGPQRKESLVLSYSNQPKGSSYSQMIFHHAKMMLPPMDKGLTINLINSQNANVTEIKATNVLTMDILAGKSNYAFKNNGQFLVFVIPYVDFFSSFTTGLLYKGRINRSTYDNVFNISDPFGEEDNEGAAFFYRKLANLQFTRDKEEEDQFFLAWQSSKPDYFEMNLMRGSGKVLTKYSSIQIQSLKTAKYMSTESILTFSTVDCQIQNYDPTNAFFTRETSLGLQSTVLVKTISNDQTKMVAVLTNTTRGNFFQTALLYDIDESGKFHQRERFKLTRPSAYGFGSSAFMGNDDYLILLQSSTEQYDPRILLYSIKEKKISTDSFILGVFSQNENGLFCVSKDSYSLFVLQREINEKIQERFSFNYYQLIDGKLVFFDSQPLQSFSRTRNISCIGDKSFVWGLFGYDNYVLSLYRANEKNKLEFVKSETNDEVGYYKISGVINDVLMIFSRTYSLTNHQLFYDANLNQIYPLFIGINYFYLKKMVDFRNGKLLIETTSAYEVWSFKQGNFIYEGGFPFRIDIYYGSSFSKKILLPLHGILYMDYPKQSYQHNNAFYFDISKPARRRLEGAGFGGTKCGSTQNQGTQWKLVRQEKQALIIVNKGNLNIIEKYRIRDKIQLVESISVDIISSSMRLSADQNNLIIWGKHQSDDQIVEIRNINNLSKVALSRRLSNLKYAISDCDFNESSELFMLTTEINNQISVFIYQDSVKIIESSPSIEKIELFASGNSIVAYIGIDSSTKELSNICIFHPLMKVKEQKSFSILCQPQLLQVSPKETSIAGVCQGNIFVYNLEKQEINYISYQGKITQIRFVSERKLAFCANNKIIITDVLTNDHKLMYLETPSANTSIAVDLNNQLIAYSSDSTNIVLADDNGMTIEEVQTPNQQSVVALTFNSDGELIVSTDGPTLFIWTRLPCQQNETVVNNYCQCRDSYQKVNSSCVCPNNLKVISTICACEEGFVEINRTCFCPNNMVQSLGKCICSQTYVEVNQTCVCPNNLTIIDGLCSCKSTYQQVDDYCICPDKSKQIGDSCSCPERFNLIQGKCLCSEGFAQEGQSCIQRECSFLCQQCNSSSLFDCSSFGVWFFIILGSITTILGGVVALTAIRIRRKRKEKQSQFTEETSQEESNYEAVANK